ncbi:hypothetical protein Tco_0140936 [Tanacetum coccineum]
MLAPKCSTFNGRPTFANPMYHKKAQYDPATRLIPDSEEILTLADKSVMETLLRRSDAPLPLRSGDSLAFINELKKEMLADLRLDHWELHVIPSYKAWDVTGLAPKAF